VNPNTANDVLRLDRNEGPPPPRELLAELMSLTSDDVARYPDPNASIGAVEAAWAARLGVDPARVVLTTGGDGAIDVFFASLFPRGAKLVLATPTFEPILAAARRAGAKVAALDGFATAYPVPAARRELSGRDDRLVVVAPNNPTGSGLERDELAALLELSDDRPLLVDLAYGEFAENDLTGGALASPSACVLLSLSKAWGLAGLRVGALVVPQRLVNDVRRERPAYPVATPSLAIARAALTSFPDLPARNAAWVRSARPRVAALLAEAGLDVRDSQANFVFARGAGAAQFAGRLARERIAVRRFDGVPELADAVRVTVPRTDAELARFEGTCSALFAGGVR
jgi:histidinol-phosphate aminotransferase